MHHTPEDQASGAPSPALPWTVEAETYLHEVPGMLRRRARTAIDAFARERGYGEIPPAVMKEARLVLLGF